jgi:hypothetical protein
MRLERLAVARVLVTLAGVTRSAGGLQARTRDRRGTQGCRRTRGLKGFCRHRRCIDLTGAEMYLPRSARRRTAAARKCSSPPPFLARPGRLRGRLHERLQCKCVTARYLRALAVDDAPLRKSCKAVLGLHRRRGERVETPRWCHATQTRRCGWSPSSD